MGDVGSWTGWVRKRSPGRRTLTTAVILCAALAALVPSRAITAAAVEQTPPASRLRVIVMEAPNAGDGPERAVEALGGRVGVPFSVIHGFAAVIPAGALDRLASAGGVRAVTPDRRLEPLSDDEWWQPAAGSLYDVDRAIRSTDAWEDGATGRGVDVALLDTGVAPVPGLTAHGKVLNGPDLSFDSQGDNVRYLDAYGHGTHLAGIIAAREPSLELDHLRPSDKAGVAPDARIVNVKVGDASGAVDVSQVLAAIDWVVQNRNRNGLNIRVLNLSFGTTSTQDYQIDPLAYAAEVAWQRGIVVVVAAGNAGDGTAELNDPASDPYVIAVGAEDTKGTRSAEDDTVPPWSSTGTGTRGPDLVAPGTSIESLRVPGSAIDVQYPAARVGSDLFKGSGTSQAAAVVSGAAALVLQKRPQLTPDQVKALLTSTARHLPLATDRSQGAGLIDVRAALSAPIPPSVQAWPRSTGTGSLELARGAGHVTLQDVPLTGEQDIFGDPWDGPAWVAASSNGSSWSDGTWMGTPVTGSCWCGLSWSGLSWSGIAWDSDPGSTWATAAWGGG